MWWNLEPPALSCPGCEPSLCTGRPCCPCCLPWQSLRRPLGYQRDCCSVAVLVLRSPLPDFIMAPGHKNSVAGDSCMLKRNHKVLHLSEKVGRYGKKHSMWRAHSMYLQFQASTYWNIFSTDKRGIPVFRNYEQKHTPKNKDLSLT